MSDVVMQGKVAEIIFMRAIEILPGILKFQAIFCKGSYWQWWRFSYFHCIQLVILEKR